MLVLTRKLGQAICINRLWQSQADKMSPEITIKIVSVSGRTVRLAIDAPTNCQIIRSELVTKSPEPAALSACEPDLVQVPPASPATNHEG